MRRTTVPKLGWGLAALVPCLLLAPSASSAENSPAGSSLSAAEARKALESLEIERETKRSREQAAREDVGRIDSELAKLNERLLETAARVQGHEGQLTAIDGRIAKLEVEEKGLRGSLADREGELSELLAALQRMGRNPPPVMITKREDALEMVRSAMLLATAFPSLKGRAFEVAGQLEGLVEVMDGLKEEREKQQKETAALNDQKLALAGLMAEKKKSRVALQNEIAELSKGVAEMAKSASSLKDLIAKSDSAVKPQTGLGAYEAEVNAADGASPSPAAQSATLVAAPALVPAEGAGGAKPTEVALAIPPPRPPEAPKPADPIIELAPAAGSLVPGSPGRIKPAIAFASARGRLPLPAQGHRALAYGDKTQFGNTSQGIVLETRANAQVTSPCDGWIVWSGEFRSYGQLLIINAGGGYHVLLAGLSQIDVQPGQFVLAAEPVGTMSGLPKTSAGTAENSGPVLYVEFRKDGEPVDPDPWWVQQKAQR